MRASTVISLMAVFALVLLFGASSPARAYIMPEIYYPQAFRESDLVVIAHPVTRTANTKEKAFVDDFGYVQGKEERLPAIGVETTFEILMVMKGESSGKQLVLHHYREQPQPPLPPGTPVMPGGGPVTVFIKNPKTSGDFLLFLTKENDGRYAPTGGQAWAGILGVFSLKPSWH